MVQFLPQPLRLSRRTAPPPLAPVVTAPPLAPTRRAAAATPTSASSPAPPAGPLPPLVFRELDRYPQILRSPTTSVPAGDSFAGPPPPSAPVPAAPAAFPSRQSSVRSKHSLFAGSAVPLPSPPAVVTGGPALLPQAQARLPLQTQFSPTATSPSSAFARDESTPSPSSSLPSFHTPAGSVDSASTADAGEHSAVQVSLTTPPPATARSIAITASPPSAARTITASSSPEHAHSTSSVSVPSSADSPPSSPLDSSVASSPTSAYYTPALNSTFQASPSEMATADSTRRPLKKVDAFFERTQSQMKKMHVKGAISSIKSSIREHHHHGHHDKHDDMSPTTMFNLADVLESELQEVTRELAASTKRELDLEMLLEKYATTSDDTSVSSGASIDDSDDMDRFRMQTKYSPGRFEELERRLRAEQQEKAQMLVHFEITVEQERRLRKDAEERYRELQEQIKVRGHGADILMSTNMAANDAVKSLQAELDATQRKLFNERINAQNLEYMLTSMREEIQTSSARLSVSIAPSPRRVSHEQRKSQETAHARSMTMSTAVSSASSVPEDDWNDPEALQTRMGELQSQRDALHDALRSLRERHELESKRRQEQVQSLQTQLTRARDLCKAISGRRRAHDQDLVALQRKFDTLRIKCEHAQDRKDTLTAQLAQMREDLTRIGNEARAGSAALDEKLDSSSARIAELERQIVSSEQQRLQAEALIEQQNAMIQKLLQSRNNMKVEHMRMVTELETNAQRLHGFMADLQQHVDSSRAFSQMFEA
ncbi:uncharacterized protein V1518DRAFT_413950 [Limtongia smithiae]|uniref:uncharacterized protein n=1 Tax=Limtongia smithiae TaxID=1125753 RepID=UPI0034CD1ABD